MTQVLPHTAAELPSAALGTALPPRVLGDVGDPDTGPTLVVVGGLHGNEPAGVRALERLFARLAADRTELPGRLLGLSGNRRALASGRRFVRLDLNRIWRPDQLERVRADRRELRDEELELAELDAALGESIEHAHGTVFVLDLHTTSGPGPAFSVLHDTLSNRRFARALPIPIALGLEEELNGTLTDHLTDRGVVALTVETGQHEDPESIDRAEAALWIALKVAGMLPERYLEEAVTARRRLAREVEGMPAAVEVRHRHAIDPDGSYATSPGFRSFQQVHAGQPVAVENGQPVTSPMTGVLLMPLYQKLGEDGFFVTRPVLSIWLSVSTLLRRLRLERILELLPGIRTVQESPHTLLVNKLVARWLALQLFHLLGYRRREHSDTHLLMERRVEPQLTH